MKFFSTVPVNMCGLLVMAGDASSILKANGEPAGMALSSASAQDAAQDSAASVAGTWRVSFTDMNGNPREAT